MYSVFRLWTCHRNLLWPMACWKTWHQQELEMCSHSCLLVPLALPWKKIPLHTYLPQDEDQSQTCSSKFSYLAESSPGELIPANQQTHEKFKKKKKRKRSTDYWMALRHYGCAVTTDQTDESYVVYSLWSENSWFPFRSVSELLFLFWTPEP